MSDPLELLVEHFIRNNLDPPSQAERGYELFRKPNIFDGSNQYLSTTRKILNVDLTSENIFHADSGVIKVQNTSIYYHVCIDLSNLYRNMMEESAVTISIFIASSQDFCNGIDTQAINEIKTREKVYSCAKNNIEKSGALWIRGLSDVKFNISSIACIIKSNNKILQVEQVKYTEDLNTLCFGESLQDTKLSSVHSVFSFALFTKTFEKEIEEELGRFINNYSNKLSKLYENTEQEIGISEQKDTATATSCGIILLPNIKSDLYKKRKQGITSDNNVSEPKTHLILKTAIEEEGPATSDTSHVLSTKRRRISEPDLKGVFDLNSFNLSDQSPIFLKEEERSPST